MKADLNFAVWLCVFVDAVPVTQRERLIVICVSKTAAWK